MIIHPLLRITIGTVGVILFLLFTPILDLCEIAFQVVLLPLIFMICVFGVGEGFYAVIRDAAKIGIFDQLRARLTAYRAEMRTPHPVS